MKMLWCTFLGDNISIFVPKKRTRYGQVVSQSPNSNASGGISDKLETGKICSLLMMLAIFLLRFDVLNTILAMLHKVCDKAMFEMTKSVR